VKQVRDKVQDDTPEEFQISLVSSLHAESSANLHPPSAYGPRGLVRKTGPSAGWPTINPREVWWAMPTLQGPFLSACCPIFHHSIIADIDPALSWLWGRGKDRVDRWLADEGPALEADGGSFVVPHAGPELPFDETTMMPASRTAGARHSP
jgi:hypothetical protein